MIFLRLELTSDLKEPLLRKKQNSRIKPGMVSPATPGAAM
jgi:hypothetical protein